MSLTRALLPAAALALVAGQALAHASLVSSTPADKASVAAPASISLKFNEAVSAKLSGATLASSRMMMNGKMTAMSMKVNVTSAADPKDGAVIVVTPKAPLTPGDYKLDWHAVSDDSHRTTGSISFSVK